MKTQQAAESLESHFIVSHLQIIQNTAFHPGSIQSEQVKVSTC